MSHTIETSKNELAEMSGRPDLDIRMVTALAGDRTLNEREKNILNRLAKERGESLFSDMLYALTHKSFPSKQAKILWEDILKHRRLLKQSLGRDVGVSIATHDYLSNIVNMMHGVVMIEEIKMSSLASTASKDGLTNLYDQATFRHYLKEEIERQVRYGGALCLVMFDLDHFKKVNDVHGHPEGDRALKKVSEILLQQVRKMDIPARYGGEEFAVILPEVDKQSAYIFAERLRQTVEESFSEAPYTVTISVGVAAAHASEDMDADMLIKRADDRLYEAKTTGRNQVKI